MAKFIKGLEKDKGLAIITKYRPEIKKLLAEIKEAESTVNQVISQRFVKKQQQRWTKKGVHLLLQVRTKVLNEELGATFQRWYPGMKLQAEINSPKEKKAA